MSQIEKKQNAKANREDMKQISKNYTQRPLPLLYLPSRNNESIGDLFWLVDGCCHLSVTRDYVCNLSRLHDESHCVMCILSTVLEQSKPRRLRGLFRLLLATQ